MDSGGGGGKGCLPDPEACPHPGLPPNGRERSGEGALSRATHLLGGRPSCHSCSKAQSLPPLRSGSGCLPLRTRSRRQTGDCGAGNGNGRVLRIGPLGREERLDGSRGLALGEPSRTRGWRNWQTRQIQVLVAERLWGFKSPSSHQREPLSRRWGPRRLEPRRRGPRKAGSVFRTRPW